MIRKATEHDIDAVERGYTELLTHEKDNGSNSNWVLACTPPEAWLRTAVGPGRSM